MKSFAILCLAGGVVTAASAQSTKPQSAEPMGAGAQAQKPMAGQESAMATGCVREAVDQPRLFVLVSDSAGASAGNPVYRLETTQLDLKSHVGKTVRVSGTLAKPSPMAAKPDKPQGKVPASVTSADVKDTPKILVSAIQPVSDTCPAAN
jgi:hypothetical protein